MVELPHVTHVPMALSTPGSTLVTVAEQLARAQAATGGNSTRILSHNRGHSDSSIAETVYVDFTEKCPREWFTRRELAMDISMGRLGAARPYYGKMYDPAISAVERAGRGGLILLYEGHYASASLPRWRRVRRDHEVVLYVHNPLSRSYGRRELRRLLGAADRTVFCADHLRHDVEARLGGSAFRLQTVTNGVSPEFLNGARPAPAGTFTIVYFGRLAANKGVHTVLEAAEIVAAKAGRPVRVRIIGSVDYGADTGHSPYERQLRVQAGALDVEVEFVPHLPRDAMASELRTAGVVCLPSTWAEGFPLTVLEAMASGVPVVTSDSPGMVEAGGDAALRFPQGDAHEAARLILTLATDDGAWRGRSVAGWERATEFTWESSLAQLQTPGRVA